LALMRRIGLDFNVVRGACYQVGFGVAGEFLPVCREEKSFLFQLDIFGVTARNFIDFLSAFRDKRIKRKLLGTPAT